MAIEKVYVNDRFNGYNGDDGAGSGGGSGGGGMEARIARLESDVHHIDKSITDIKDGLKEIRGEIRDHRKETAKHFQWLFGTIIVGVVGVLLRMFTG